MILTPGNKFWRLQTKVRKGSSKEIDAFDFNEKDALFHSSRDLLLQEMEFPETGYIFKPSQQYIFVGDGVLNTAEWFNPTLKLLGVQFNPINAKDYILSFKFPVKLYNDTSLFIS